MCYALNVSLLKSPVWRLPISFYSWPMLFAIKRQQTPIKLREKRFMKELFNIFKVLYQCRIDTLSLFYNKYLKHLVAGAENNL